MNDRWAYRRTTVSAVVIANLLPFLGLLVLEWEVIELLMVYWLEAIIAVPIGIAKTFPARLVGVPLTNPRSKPLLKARNGTISVGNTLITGYIRNIPVIASQLVFYVFWAVPMLALFLPASPLYYSAHGTVESVAIAAILLAMTHVLTAKSYFDEKRHEQVPARGSAGSSFTTGMVVFGLVAVLLVWDSSFSGPIVEAWPASLSYVIVGGKASIDLFMRFRNWDRFERLDEDTDPFDFETSATNVLLLREPGMKVAELPRVERPDTWPRATVRPSRWGIVRASPILGTRESRDAAPHIFFALAILFVVADVRVILPLATVSLAIVFAVAPVLLYTLPRHATLEYECYDDRLVCYDFWLERAQWQLPYEDIERIESTQSRVGRLLGYGTVTLETADDQPARLAYLREYVEVADRLERATRRGVRANGR